MIILDTNVLSEMMRPTPDTIVSHWVDSHPPGDLFTTAITIAEIYYGIELLEMGKRRNDLLAAAARIFTQTFFDRTLSFDADAARIFAEISALRRRRGRPIREFDAQIASIVQLHGATLATRNTADFESCGIRLIDPWQT